MANDLHEALERVDALKALDDHDVVPACATHLLCHGDQTDEAVVLLHGFTNSPVQCREIAEAFFDHGANVLVPRLPFHGLVDPYSTRMSDLTPDVLSSFTDTVVDASAGLGRRVRVIGLSLGGLLAAYAGKFRDEVDEAVMVAPFFQPKGVPVWIEGPFNEAMKALPDHYNWWNAKVHQVEVAGTFAYPKFSLKAVAAQIHLRRHLELTPSARKVKLDRALLVLNDADSAVRANVAQRLLDEQFTPIAENTVTEHIEASFGFTHDLFEPNGNNRDSMDAVRDRLWPVLGLAAPPHDTLDGPTPGGGYFPELGPWADEDPPSDWPNFGARYTRNPQHLPE